MKFQADIKIPKPKHNIHFNHKILLIGSCFTEHIGNALIQNKFEAMQNPSGILFDPISVCNNLQFYLENRKWEIGQLHCHDELYYSWFHHGDFSSINPENVLKNINEAHEKAHYHLLSADWLIITLGSSFVYRLLKNNSVSVANCHRAPADFFEKYLLSADEIFKSLYEIIEQIRKRNPNLKIILTISPVRHLRDGLIENNRSKAKLIEAVHRLVEAVHSCYYFPSYELVIDVLRDYRFYDIDLAHPNYSATSFVLSHFKQTFLDKETLEYFDEIHALKTAQYHRSINPETKAHQAFLLKMKAAAEALQVKYSTKNFQSEIAHFSDSNSNVE